MPESEISSAVAATPAVEEQGLVQPWREWKQEALEGETPEMEALCNRDAELDGTSSG